MTPSHKSRSPHIDAVRPITDPVPGADDVVVAGTVLRVSGANFGARPDRVAVHFDEVVVRPFSAPFASGELLVTAPLPTSRTSTVRIVVSGRGSSSPAHIVVVRPPARDGAPGAATFDLMAALDEQAALTAQFTRLVAALPLGDGTASTYLSVSGDAIDGVRCVAQRAFETWLQWAPAQAAEVLPQLRTIELLDEAVSLGGLTDLVRRQTAAIFGLEGLVDGLLPGGVGQLFEVELDDLAGQLLELLDFSDLLGKLREIGGWIGENVITAEGIEDILKFVKPSIEGGASVVIQGSLDAEFDIAQIVSGFAEFIGLSGETITEAAGGTIDDVIAGLGTIAEQIGMLEVKNDQLITTIAGIDDRARRTSAEVFANESKLDRLGRLLGLTLVGSEWIVDDRETRERDNEIPERDVKQELHDIEDGIIRLEEKGDRHEEKLDRLGVIGAPQEGSVASQRGGGSRVTGAVAAVRSGDRTVHIRTAVDVPRSGLARRVNWSDWVDFDRPRSAGRLVDVSLDLQYEDDSDRRMTGLLSARDAAGNVFHREFRGPDHDDLNDPDRWGRWQRFLMQP